jgi:hypothetical protein
MLYSEVKIQEDMMYRGRDMRRMTRRLDAGGARQRALERERAFDEAERTRQADRDRVIKAAGRIPVLNTLADVTAYTSEVEGVLGRGRSLSFPAVQVSRRLSIDGIFRALPHTYRDTPNVKAQRHEETSVGPHFDDYAANGFRPWTLHENHSGTGIIRATFLPEAQYKAYNSLARSLPDTDASDELLAQTRASMGSIALDTAHDSRVFVGGIEPGTRTLLWHGDRNTPPAVHDIQRNEPGDYTIYAIQNQGDLAAGFEEM